MLANPRQKDGRVVASRHLWNHLSRNLQSFFVSECPICKSSREGKPILCQRDAELQPCSVIALVPSQGWLPPMTARLSQELHFLGSHSTWEYATWPVDPVILFSSIKQGSFLNSVSESSMRSKNILMSCPSSHLMSPSSASYICVCICLPFPSLQLLVGQILEV